MTSGTRKLEGFELWDEGQLPYRIPSSYEIESSDPESVATNYLLYLQYAKVEVDTSVQIFLLDFADPSNH